MKAVIYFVFKDTEDNYIEDIQKQLTYDVNQFIITDVTNPNKSIYNKIENIILNNNKKFMQDSIEQS